MNAEYRGLSPLNILLAEDERFVAFSIVFALKIDGHNVRVVADGWQALASISVERDRFVLLITDHSMPGMIGVDYMGKTDSLFARDVARHAPDSIERRGRGGRGV